MSITTTGQQMTVDVTLGELPEDEQVQLVPYVDPNCFHAITDALLGAAGLGDIAIGVTAPVASTRVTLSASASMTSVRFLPQRR